MTPDPEPVPIPEAEALRHWAARDAGIRRLARTPRADLGLRYFDIRRATGIDDARWQPFQVDVLNEEAPFSIMNKSRQIGASFTAAADELFDGILKGNHTCIFVSFNLEEATEKIRYAQQWWTARNPEPQLVPARGEFDATGNHRGVSPRRIQRWPELVRETGLQLEWENGFRLISHPCRPPRGKRASVVLDEFAHYQADGPIYTAALPMITRGRGRNRMRIMSTPRGGGGKFHDIFTDERAYQDFARVNAGWWEVEDLCPAEQRLECRARWQEGVPMDLLVGKYGTRQLRLLFNNTLREDFYQEFCLAFLDAVHAFLPWELIRACYPSYFDPLKELVDDEADAEAQLLSGYRTAYPCARGRGLEECLRAVRDLWAFVDQGLIGRKLVMAYDCGRDHDVSEVSIWEEFGGQHLQRGLLTMAQMSFDHQKTVLNAVCGDLPILRGMMDQGGPGRQIAEEMNARWGRRAEGVWFDWPKKELWATTLKRDMQQRKVTLVPDREQEQQLHSIKRVVTDAANMKYVIEESTASVGGGQRIKHHADKFWVVSMANFLCEQVQDSQGVPIVGDGGRTAAQETARAASRGYGGAVSSARAAAERVRGRVTARR